MCVRCFNRRSSNSWVVECKLLYSSHLIRCLRNRLLTHLYEIAACVCHLLSVLSFNTDGEAWKRQRKVASYIFTARNLKEEMSKVFISNGKKVCERLSQHAESGTAVDIQDLFFRYTLDSFTEIAFGDNPNSLERDVDFANAFDVVQRCSNERWFDPFWKVWKLFGIGREREIRKQVPIISSYAMRVIHERKSCVERGNKPDLLSRFISYSESKNEQISDVDLRDIFLNFVIAGKHLLLFVCSSCNFYLCYLC